MSALAHVGGWSFGPATGEGRWTAETARIHDLPDDALINVEAGIRYYVGEHQDVIRKAVAAAIEQGKPYDLELQIQTATGRRKWIRTVGHPVLEQGRVTRVYGVMQDISGRRRTEDELRGQTTELLRRNQELERFDHASVGRELEMIRLKRQVNELSLALGQPAPYDLSFADDASADGASS